MFWFFPISSFLLALIFPMQEVSIFRNRLWLPLGGDIGLNAKQGQQITGKGTMNDRKHKGGTHRQGGIYPPFGKVLHDVFLVLKKKEIQCPRCYSCHQGSV